MSILFFSSLVLANEEITIFAYKSNQGFTFRNFSFMLTPENTVLASDTRLKEKRDIRDTTTYKNDILDEKSRNYIDYGQFEIFIPNEKFPLINSSASFIIARMPQTDPKSDFFEEKIAKKKSLYKKIKKMVNESKGQVNVVFEFPHPNSEEIGSNIFFRSYNGEYIDRVGKL